MARFVALYRGINVGGRNSAKMETLRAMHERLGHGDVASYIQSGNIVFSTGGTAAALAKKISAQFAEEFGFAAQVIVVSKADWKTLVRDNPYADISAQDPRLVHAGICDGRPSAAGLKQLLERTGGREAFIVTDRIIYLHAPDGVGNSKFAAGMEKASGVAVTARNWRTIEAIWKMLES